jgi:hypothetical protein
MWLPLCLFVAYCLRRFEEVQLKRDLPNSLSHTQELMQLYSSLPASLPRLCLQDIEEALRQCGSHSGVCQILKAMQAGTAVYVSAGH